MSLWLTQGADGIATVWPASGVLLAALILLPAPAARRTAALTALASVVANIGAGASVGTACAFTTANLVEAGVGAHLWRRLGGGRTLFLDGRDVARFCVTATGAALVSAGSAWALSGAPDGVFAASWFATVLLGLLIVTPALIVMAELRRPDAATTGPIASPVASVATLLVVAATTALTFWQSSYPLFFVPLIALLAATHLLGVLGASMGVLVVAVIGSGLSYAGHGPLMLMAGSAQAKSFFLQLYFLALFATALPLAALLASRERLAIERVRSERMHRLLAEASSDIVVRFALDGTPLYVSPACRAILGYAPEEMLARGAVRDIHSDDRAAVLAAWAKVSAGAEVDACLYRQRRNDGREVWLEAAYRLVGAEATGGEPEIVATVRDVTRRREAELEKDRAAERLEQANAMLAEAEAVAHLGHWRIDLQTGAVIWSDEVARIHDWRGPVPRDREEALLLYHADDREHVRATVRRAMESGAPFTYEARLVTGTGEIRHVVSNGRVKLDAAGAPAMLFGTVQNVTEWVAIKDELDRARSAAESAAARALQLADTDALTGVASRRRIMTALDHAFAAAERGARALTVAVLDVDHFKRVNDVHGHGVGDAVLVHVARSVEAKLRAGDMVGRLGGEEFVIIGACADGQEAFAMSERLRLAVREAFGKAGHLPPVTVSIGVAAYNGQDSASALLQAADQALYAAKNAGRDLSRLAA